MNQAAARGFLRQQGSQPAQQQHQGVVQPSASVPASWSTGSKGSDQGAPPVPLPRPCSGGALDSVNSEQAHAAVQPRSQQQLPALMEVNTPAGAGDGGWGWQGITARRAAADARQERKALRVAAGPAAWLPPHLTAPLTGSAWLASLSRVVSSMVGGRALPRASRPPARCSRRSAASSASSSLAPPCPASLRLAAFFRLAQEVRGLSLLCCWRSRCSYCWPAALARGRQCSVEIWLKKTTAAWRHHPASPASDRPVHAEAKQA